MFALPQNASRISLRLLTWLKEMLMVRERESSGLAPVGGDFKRKMPKSAKYP